MFAQASHTMLFVRPLQFRHLSVQVGIDASVFCCSPSLTSGSGDDHVVGMRAAHFSARAVSTAALTSELTHHLGQRGTRSSGGCMSVPFEDSSGESPHGGESYLV